MHKVNASGYVRGRCGIRWIRNAMRKENRLEIILPPVCVRGRQTIRKSCKYWKESKHKWGVRLICQEPIAIKVTKQISSTAHRGRAK